MKLIKKLKLIVLITLVILITLAIMITINLSLITDDNNVNNFDNGDLRIAKAIGKIHIDDDNPTINWSVAKKDGICTGNGTYSDPYVIEDLEIDGEGLGSCIWIDNSEVYFRIENCTLFNSGEGFDDAGIKLVNVNNGHIYNNNCSNNNNKGIRLWNCNNSIISGNIVKNNSGYGIALYGSSNNSISGNTISNTSSGIMMQGWISEQIKGDNNIISGNSMNDCGLRIHGNLEILLSTEIDTTNLVNGKPVYYCTNEANLRSNDFPNAGQLILVNCSGSLISNLNISYTTIAISLHYCDNNIISGNILNNNTYYGIFLVHSDNNDISGNNAITNRVAGICFWNSNNNNISGNTVENSYYLGGIYFTNCNNNTVSKNTVNNSKRFHGICIEYSTNNIISENIVNNNNWSGICLVNSDYNIISGNIANYNKECGILLHLGNYNTISGNTANYNRWGIILYESDYNTVSGNNLIGNYDECIAEINCQGNIIKDNKCTITPSLNYLPIILTITIPIVVVSTFIIYQNRKRFRNPQEDLEFL
jgi:parallel beta-helix repeat protein